MIPKTIHYCWLGDKPKSEKEIKCINSWKKFCPDYEIKEWNNNNVDLDLIPFVRQAYECEKYAFASDVLRLWAIYTYGGIYFDTDVELIRNFDELLDCKGFIGFENNSFVNTGQCVACEKDNPIIRQMLDYYSNMEFNPNNIIKCTEINTNVLIDNGLELTGEKQDIDGFIVYPTDYFNPYDDATGRLNKTDNTYSIHWYSKSWMSKGTILRSKLTKPLHRLQALLKK